MVLSIVHARAARPTETFGRIDVLENATIRVDGGRMLSVSADGPVAPGDAVIDAGGRLVTPGLVDCHTHAWFLGDRAGEFGERMAGASYLEIGRRGGGIQSTVGATRAGPLSELRRLLAERLRRLELQGVTTVEVKSGYGLTVESELEALENIGKFPCASPTLLAAHALPPEVRNEAERRDWMDQIIQRLIPEVARRKLAERVDVFVESGAYTPAEAEQIAAAAKAHGLAVHLHVDQLSDGSGAALAARLGAQAAAHLEHASDEGIAALAKAGTVAVLIPTATLVAGITRFAPARKVIQAGVPIALATNLNPGTGPSESSALLFFMAATGLRMSPAEILWAATRGGALALGRSDLGRLEPGARGDLVLWQASDLAHLPYHAGVNHVRLVIREGQVIHDRSQQAEAECSGVL